jgi:hypothetical protein
LDVVFALPNLEDVDALEEVPVFFPSLASFSLARASIKRFLRSTLLNFSLGAGWCFSIPTWVGACCCAAFALAIRSA